MTPSTVTATQLVVIVMVGFVSSALACQSSVSTDRQAADKCLADKNKNEMDVTQLKRQVEDLRRQVYGSVTSAPPPIVKGSCVGTPAIMIQRHGGGSSFFNKTWADLTNRTSIVPPSIDFWIGLDTLTDLTSDGRYKLRIDLTATNGTTYWAEYTTFMVGNNASKYELTISGFSGNIFDSMDYHNRAQFTTKDHDNDFVPGVTAQLYGGAWWYKQSFAAGLNSAPAYQFAWNTTNGYIALSRDTMSLVCK